MADGLRPLIGVTTSEIRIAEHVQQTPQGEPPRRELALGLTYVQAIEAAGGTPVIIPLLGFQAIDSLLARVSGICIPGGPDLDPRTYDAPPHAELGPIEPELDQFELEVARRSDALGIPLLAICRGAQAVNVARGGTLHQHLPDRPGTRCEHRQAVPGNRSTHAIEVSADSALHGLLGRRRLRVNSFHHQAVDRLGAGLRATAWSPDGVIEAIEAPGRDFLVGVQWHAETLTHRRDNASLFAGLVEAAAGRAPARRLTRVA